LNGIDTITSYDIEDTGNIDTDKFLHTLKTVIFPTMNRYGTGPRCVAVLDNCRIHQKDEIYAIAAEFGIKVLFLPPYSYDYNPIELCFHLSKALIKKRNNDNRNRNKSLIFQFEEALYECCDQKMAAQLFRKCFIPVDLEI
jgi:transposase